MAKEIPFEVLESNYHKLEDLKNCVESLNQKIGYLQVDLFNHPEPKLEKFLGNFNGKMTEVHNDVIEVFTEYQEEKYYPAKGLETFNSTDEQQES